MSSVDVVVPCYRYGRFLRQAVESVLNQQGPKVRVLIINDASPDGTAAVAAELAAEDVRVTVIDHAANRGHIDTYNEGIAWASADYMLILSADDYLLPGALERAARLLDSNPEVGLTFGDDIVTYDAEDVREIPRRRVKAPWRIMTGPEFVRLSGSYNIVSTPSAIVRTALQKRVGGYRPALPHAGDMEMWFRFAAHGSVGQLHAYQAVYRRHTGNMSSAYYQSRGRMPDLEQRRDVLDSFFATCGFEPSLIRELRGRAMRSLACHAVALAGEAYLDDKMDDSRKLTEFALAIDPRAKMSGQWAKLMLKRLLGSRLWRVVRTPVAAARQSRAQVGMFWKRFVRSASNMLSAS